MGLQQSCSARDLLPDRPAWMEYDISPRSVHFDHMEGCVRWKCAALTGRGGIRDVRYFIENVTCLDRWVETRDSPIKSKKGKREKALSFTID